MTKTIYRIHGHPTLETTTNAKTAELASKSGLKVTATTIKV